MLLAATSLMLAISTNAYSAESYESANVVNGATILDASVERTYGVSLDNGDVEVALTGAQPGKKSSIGIIAVQGASGGSSIKFPSSVKMPVGVYDLVDTESMRLTSIRLSSTDGGDTWLAEKLSAYDSENPPAINLPELLSDNATFNDEGYADGWTALNATVSTVDGWLSYTKPSLGISSILKPAEKPSPDSDYILYVKLKATYSPKAVSVVQFYDMATGRAAGIWLGSANATTTPAQGSISLIGTTNNGTTRNAVTIATGVDYWNNSIDAALHWDSTYSVLNCYFRESDGRWKLKGRVRSEYVGGPNISAQFTPETPSGSELRIDYITVARPNIISLGDSIAAGATLNDPNPDSSLINDESTWMRHARIYQKTRNNLIVNKGIPGITSAQTLARMDKINSSGAKVVFYHGPTNDQLKGISHEASKSNVQNIVSSVNSNGGKVVLLNQIYGTASSAGNQPEPRLRDYGIEAWNNYLVFVSGVYSRIDIMYALKGKGRFIDPSLAQSDGHPNIEGYKAIGRLISR